MGALVFGRRARTYNELCDKNDDNGLMFKNDETREENGGEIGGGEWGRKRGREGDKKQ